MIKSPFYFWFGNTAKDRRLTRNQLNFKLISERSKSATIVVNYRSSPITDYRSSVEDFFEDAPWIVSLNNRLLTSAVFVPRFSGMLGDDSLREMEQTGSMTLWPVLRAAIHLKIETKWRTLPIHSTSTLFFTLSHCDSRILIYRHLDLLDFSIRLADSMVQEWPEKRRRWRQASVTSPKSSSALCIRIFRDTFRSFAIFLGKLNKETGYWKDKHHSESMVHSFIKYWHTSADNN